MLYLFLWLYIYIRKRHYDYLFQRNGSARGHYEIQYYTNIIYAFTYTTVYNSHNNKQKRNFIYIYTRVSFNI